MLPIQSNRCAPEVQFTRRDILKGLGIAALVGLASCTPVKYILNPRPKRYLDPSTLERTLRAFAETIIPGAPLDEPNLVRIFTDDYYPFAEYAAFFANDLDSRSHDTFRREFAELTQDDRTTIVKAGLAADATMSRLYYAAIYMTKVSFFGGIYDDTKGCPMIEFYGKDGFMSADMYYDNASQYLAREITINGNYH